MPPPVEEITPAYLEGVLDQLYAMYRDTLAQAKAENSFGERYYAAMATIYTAEAAGKQTKGLESFGGVAVVASVPGKPTTQSIRVLHTDPDCVFLSADIDLNPLVTKPIEARQPYYVKLVPENTSRLNPTPWLIGYASFTDDGKQPDSEDRCPT